MRYHITCIFFMLHVFNVTPSEGPVQSVDTFFVVKVEQKKSDDKMDPKEPVLIDSYKSYVKEHGQRGTIKLRKNFQTGTLSPANTDTQVKLDRFSVDNIFTELESKSNATIINGRYCCIFRSPSGHIVQLSYPKNRSDNCYKQQCIYVPPTAGKKTQTPTLTRTNSHKQDIASTTTTTTTTSQDNEQIDREEPNTHIIQRPYSTSDQQTSNVTSMDNSNNYLPYAAAAALIIFVTAAIGTHR